MHTCMSSISNMLSISSPDLGSQYWADILMDCVGKLLKSCFLRAQSASQHRTNLRIRSKPLCIVEYGWIALPGHCFAKTIPKECTPVHRKHNRQRIVATYCAPQSCALNPCLCAYWPIDLDRYFQISLRTDSSLRSKGPRIVPQHAYSYLVYWIEDECTS